MNKQEKDQVIEMMKYINQNKESDNLDKNSILLDMCYRFLWDLVFKE